MGGSPSRQFLCLFWRETRQRVFGSEISRYPEMVRGREEELAWNHGQRQLATGQQRGESAEVWAWDHGQGQSTPDTGAVRPTEKIGSSEEDRVKRCRHSSCFVEFLLVTHTSVNLHMHVVLHTLLLLWVNPKHCSCLFYFLRPPRSYSCSGQKCALPPSNH